MKLLSYSELHVVSRSDTRPNGIPPSKGTLENILSVKLVTTHIWDVNIGNWIAQTIGLNNLLFEGRRSILVRGAQVMTYVYNEYYVGDCKVQQAEITADAVYDLLTTSMPYDDESDPKVASNIVFSSAQIEGYDYAGPSPRT